VLSVPTIYGRSDDANSVSRLSDQELVAQLADLSKQLGVDINLNYSFVQQPCASKTGASE
jgi:hypothetical protein